MLDGIDGLDEEAKASIKEQIAARENDLKGVYTQIATEFAAETVKSILLALANRIVK